MKKILNNIGAISKQVIVGGAIGVATLMVGIGLMNNFSSGGDSEKGFASNAMERGYSSYEGTSSGASADDILSARNYAQGSREGSVSAITGTDRLALSRRNSVQNPSGAVAGQANFEVEDSSTGYGAGEIEGMGTSGQVKVSVSAEDAAAAKAQRDAKIAKGEALGAQARATLKTSKMADGSGIKGIETGSSGMTYGTPNSSYAGGTGGSLDSSKVALAQAKFNNTDLKGASGKLGTMGSNSTEADGQRRGRAALGQHSETLGDLGRASKYSRTGKQAVVADAAKGAADAAAAFDGSKDAEAVNLDGANLQQAALNSLKDMGAGDMQAGLDKIREDLNQVDETMNKWSDLIDKIKDCVMAMVLAASIASIAVGIFSKIEPWGAAAALAAAAVGTAAILAAQISASAFLGQISNLAATSGIDSIKPTAWDWTSPWLIGGLLAGCIWASWALAGFGSAQLVTYLGGFINSLAGGGATTAISHFFSKLGKKK